MRHEHEVQQDTETVLVLNDSSLRDSVADLKQTVKRIVNVILSCHYNSLHMYVCYPYFSKDQSINQDQSINDANFSFTYDGVDNQN